MAIQRCAELLMLSTLAIVVGCTRSTGLEILSLPSEEKSCFPALFSFGSSVADTGAGVILDPTSRAVNSPYGATYFKEPTGRWSDGRLHIDLWAKALRLQFLDSFIRSVNTNFLQGTNFATAGGTAKDGGPPIAFALAIQLHQFRQFKKEVLSLQKGQADNTPQNCRSSLPEESYFRDALYIVAVGGNDIGQAFKDPVEVEDFPAFIPTVSDAIVNVVKGLYDEGARNILVEDVYPIGCLGSFLTNNAPYYGESARIDSTGCSRLFNDVVQAHNALLRKRIEALVKELPDLSAAVVGTYSIRYDMMTNPSKYGFKEGIKACCGSGGGKYNYDDHHKCGTEGVQACDNMTDYVVWDSIHFTEAANFITMKAILSGDHFYPAFRIERDSCTLADIES